VGFNKDLKNNFMIAPLGAQGRAHKQKKDWQSNNFQENKISFSCTKF